MGQITSGDENTEGRANEPARILVVDNDEQILGLLTHVLESAGYVVEARPDGASALEALSAHRFDLVITDLAMPRPSGAAVLGAAKALEPAIPVVIITGRTSDEEEARLRVLGADEILLKPFQMGDLISVVERLLSPPGQGWSER